MPVDGPGAGHAPRPLTRVAAYIRVSKEEQALGYGLDFQRRLIRDYCGAREWGEPAWFEDAGQSAWTEEVGDRPAFARMLDACHAGGYDRVVVHKLDRWARDLIVGVRELRALQRVGVGFVSVSEQFDFATPFGQVMLAVLAAFAQHYSDLISERTRLGLATKRLNGEPLGRRPFGATLGADRRYAVDPAREDDLRRVLGWAPAHSWEGLARALNVAGVRARFGGGWSEASVRRFVLRSSDWLLAQPEPWPALVEAARARAARPPVPARAEIHMLTGLARCRCGGRLHYYRARGRLRLQCRHPAARPERGGYGCPYGGFTWAAIYEAQVVAQVRALGDPVASRAASPGADAAARARAELAEDGRRLAATYRARLIDDAEFDRERRALAARLAALPRPAASRFGLAELLPALRETFAALPPVEQNGLLRQCCDAVTIAGATARVEWTADLLSWLPAARVAPQA